MRKLITFLGVGDYEEVTYCWKDKECKTRFFPVAVSRWVEPDCIVVMLTEKAEEKNWEACKLDLERIAQLQPVRIPEGKSEEELWQIFKKLTDQVKHNDTLILDITHSFRSLPMISFLALAYLRLVKNTTIEYLLYGAYEARDNQKAPVFDLTPFLDLLEWLGSAKMFITTGMGHELAELIEKAHDRPWRQGGSGPKKLKSLATALEEVSDMLLLSRVPLMKEALDNFTTQLRSAEQEIGGWAPPLVPLLERVASEYTRFQNADHCQQVELIEWYLKRGHIVQAVTLMREWLVSEQVRQMGRNPNEPDKNARKEAEQILGQAYSLSDRSNPLYSFWSQVVDLRNDIAHCGFRPQPLQPEAIRQQAHELLNQIKEHINNAEKYGTD